MRRLWILQHSGKAKEVGISETLNVHISGAGWDGVMLKGSERTDAKESNPIFICSDLGADLPFKCKYWCSPTAVA